MRIVAFVLMLLASASSSFASDPIDELRRAEIAFAKAFADRDSAKFFAMVADDATFFSRARTLSGKKEVVAEWSRYLEPKTAPFSWGPERVSVNAEGTIGESTGPVYDANGKHVGDFTSIWVKQPNGSWKILFDGNGPSPASFADSALKTEEGFVAAGDGVKLHYRKVGNGPATIIAPLGFVLHDDFKQLADLATVITYDMRNRGRSERAKDEQTWTIQQDVEDLEAVRKHFKVDKFVPVGYSYLGLMVALYALDHPDRVARIVQLGPVPMNVETEYPKQLTHGREDVAAPADDVKRWEKMRAAGMAEKTPREYCEAQWKVSRYALVGNGANVSRVKEHCDLENEWPVNFEKHLQRHFASVQQIAITKERLAALTMPVLTIHGTKDRNAPYGSGREWALTLSNARLVTVAEGAHQSWADDPVAVFSAIREFLRGNWPLGTEKVTRLEP